MLTPPLDQLTNLGANLSEMTITADALHPHQPDPAPSFVAESR